VPHHTPPASNKKGRKVYGLVAEIALELMAKHRIQRINQFTPV